MWENGGEVDGAGGVDGVFGGWEGLGVPWVGNVDGVVFVGVGGVEEVGFDGGRGGVVGSRRRVGAGGEARVGRVLGGME